MSVKNNLIFVSMRQLLINRKHLEIFVNICLILFFRHTRGLFVQKGEYPNYPLVNLPECGEGVKLKLINFTRDETCFFNPHPNLVYAHRFGQPGLQEITGQGVDPEDMVSSRIYNGRDVRIGESPWTVRLLVFYEVRIRGTGGVDRVVERGSRTCTGALVTFQWVITAAHCFLFEHPRKVAEIHVWAGDKDIRNNGNIRKLYRHQEFDNSSNEYRVNRDIALFQLDRKYDSDRKNDQFTYLNTICLPDNSPPNTNIDDATTTGWGVIDKNWKVPKKLQIAQMRIEPSNDCPRKFTVCAKPIRRQPKPCTADSGGPLIQYLKDGRAVLIGVLSAVSGPHCMPTRGTDLIEWVSPMAHIQWILETIRKHN